MLALQVLNVHILLLFVFVSCFPVPFFLKILLYSTYHVIPSPYFADTTAAYWRINNPLRDRKRYAERRPHPLPATVFYIQDGIKKLRAAIVEANNSESKHDSNQSGSSTVLWRGMKNVKVGDRFKNEGGTELAPMSTTSDLDIAIKYGTCSTGSLIFKIQVPDALASGADLEWLSAFPTEAEVLYPPLTFLRPTGRMQSLTSEVSGAQVTIMEVTPDLSA